jgi:tetratricopeptide (TPR) repeat protein
LVQSGLYSLEGVGLKRFERLEFDEPDPGQLPAGQAPEQDHDERYWLACADKERREGLFENALRFYSRSLEFDKSLVEAWVGQVQMLIVLGEYPEAELWSRKALELFHNHGDLMAGRAQALARIGNLSEALPLSDGALKQEGQSSYRWMVRGEIMAARGQEIEQHCFEKAMQVDHDWLVLVEIGQIYRFRGKPAKALARLRQAVAQAPDQPYCWLVQGCCERELGLYSAAFLSFEKCLELKPNHLEAKRHLNELNAHRWTLAGRLKRLFRLQ